jgi:hypothetical protein
MEGPALHGFCVRSGDQKRLLVQKSVSEKTQEGHDPWDMVPGMLLGCSCGVVVHAMPEPHGSGSGAGCLYQSWKVYTWLNSHHLKYCMDFKQASASLAFLLM